jgi:hypothetical protein
VSIFDANGAALVSEATATLDGPSTTISTYSATAPRYAVLAAVTGIRVGEEYWIVNPDGRAQSVRVVGVTTSSKTVQFADEPEFAPVVGANFYSYGASYAVGATVLANYGQGYRAEWSWTCAGVTVITEAIFDVVHSPATCPGTGAGLRRAHPWTAERWDQISDTHTWDDLVQQAFLMCLYELESYVIEKRHDMPHAIVDWQQWEPVIYARVLADHAEHLIPPDWTGFPQDYAARSWAKYKTAFEACARNMRYDDVDQTRAGTDMKRRSGMLVP